MGGATLECGIGFTVVPHTIDDFSTPEVFLHHVVDRIGIVLQVSIHRNNSVDIHTQCMH